MEITNLNVEGCKSYLPVFSIISRYLPVNATGMANMLICRHFANLDKRRIKLCFLVSDILPPTYVE